MKICPNYGCRSHIRQQVPRHPGESRDLGFRSTDWIPAFAGMTEFADVSVRGMESFAFNETQP